ncbi:MAG: pyridoxal 5'-phosphate synthase glutaminase subunit PdxT [Waddliaceae bacterium]
MKKTVGVLSLQGGFSKHFEKLQQLNVNPLLVRTKEELALCDGLILPGGESTTMSRHLTRQNLLDPISEFAKSRPVFGTCAGLILLAKRVAGSEMKTLDAMDITVERNGYGSQINSFSTFLEMKSKKIPALFIRAPVIQNCSNEVEILLTHNNSPVLIRQNHLLGATFHPELTDSLLIHRFFVKLL